MSQVAVEKRLSLFTNPLVLSVTHDDAGPQQAIDCSFNEALGQGSGWANSPSLAGSPLFRPDSKPVLLLEKEQLATLRLSKISLRANPFGTARMSLRARR